MNKFEIIIASVPDREHLVAEIWYTEILIAEISQENEKLEIELYQFKKVKFVFDEFLDALNSAKEKLIGK